MAARTFPFRRLICTVGRHKWDWRASRGEDVPYRCERCGCYDDEPSIVRWAARRAWLERWSPVGLSVRGGDARVSLRIRPTWHLTLLSLGMRLHYKARRDDEKPGVWLWFEVWRLHFWGGAGFFWLNEDGDNRTLLHFGASFETFGLAEHVCRVLGHKPGEPLMSGTVYCERCNEILTERKPTTGAVAA